MIEIWAAVDDFVYSPLGVLCALVVSGLALLVMDLRHRSKTDRRN
jgi:hypothetical protein